MAATLKSRLPQIISEIPRKMHKVEEKAKREIASQARATAPRRTGRLALSYRPAAGGVSSAWYYRFTEFGTRKQSAQPHLVPAAEVTRVRWVQDAKSELRSL